MKTKLLLTSLFFILTYQKAFLQNKESDNLVVKLTFESNILNQCEKEQLITSRNISYAKDRFNNENSAVYFNGQSQILIENSNDLSFLKNFTIALWFYPDTAEDMVIFAKSGDRTGLELKYHKDGRLDLHNGFCCPITGIIELGKIAAKKWYHVAISADDKKIYVYLNSILLKTTDLFDFDINSQMAKEPLRLGVGFGGAYYSFQGAMDALYIYKQSLNENQIKDLYRTK